MLLGVETASSERQIDDAYSDNDYSSATIPAAAIFLKYGVVVESMELFNSRCGIRYET